MIAYSRGIKKKKESLKKKRTGKIFLFFLIFIFVFLVVLNLKIRSRINEAKKEANLLEQEAAKLKESNDKFSSAFEENEESFLEKFSREELNLQKAGEKVVAFPIVGESVEATSTGEGEAKEGIGGENTSLWQKFLKMLKIR